jgi:hypothetical protein
VNQVLLSAFSDELSKIAASHGLTHVSKSRRGTRPISVARLLAKDNDGSLRKTKTALSASDITAAGLGAATLAGGVAGYKKGKETDRPISGALRGAFGAGGGAYQGMLMGAGLGAAAPMIHPALKSIPTKALGAVPLIGAGLGSLAGYKLVTHGLDKKKEADAQGAPQDVRGDSKDDGAAAQMPKRTGEVPSQGTDNIAVGQKTGSFLFPTGVEKERLDAKNDLETSRGVHGLAATSGLGAAYMAARVPKSLHEIVGGQQLYHGTTDPAAASIRKGGLDPSLGGTELGGAAAEKSKAYAADSKGKTFVSTSPGESRVYADMTQSRLEGKPYDQVSSGIKAVVPGATKGTVLKGALPYEDFHNRFKVDKTMPILGAAPTAYFTNKRVEPEVFKSGLGDVVKKRLKDPSSLGGYLKSNPKRALKGVGALAAIPALAYAAPKLWGKGTEMRHAAKDKLDSLDKTGASMFKLPSKEEADAGLKQTAGQGMMVAGGGSLLGAVGLASDAPKHIANIVGAQPFYHGTSAPAAESIARTGLDPARGGLKGSGGAIASHTEEVRQEMLKNPVFRAITGTRSADELRKQHEAFAERARGHAFVGTDKDTAGGYADIGGDGKGRVLRGVLPTEEFQQKFVPDIDHDPRVAFKTKEHIPAEAFKRTIGDVAKQRLKHPSSWGGYLKKNPGRAAAGLGSLAAIPALGYLGYKGLSKGNQIRKAGNEEWEALQPKEASLQGANTQTSPVMSGEDLRGAVANKARQRGDTPTQDVAADQPNGRIEPHAKSITFDQSAKPVKRGDTPTLNNDMNLVSKMDGRGEATTVTGLAQNSNNVGAFNSPSEHT